MPGEQGPPGGPPAAPRRPRRRWPWAVAFLLVAGLLVARQAVPGHSLPPCPSGHAVATVKQFRPHLTAAITPGPGAEPTTSWSLSVDFEVRNNATAAVQVDQVLATVVGHPEARIDATGEGQRLDPGGIAVVTGTTDVIEPGADITVGPTPDATAVVLDARWVDQGKYPGCHI